MRGNYQLWTDGSCRPNPGVMGWAYMLKNDAGHVVSCGSGSGGHGTNQRAELLAAVEGLEASPEGVSIELVSDSLYLLDWIERLLRIDSQRLSPEVDHYDVLVRLKRLCVMRDVSTRHVRGHAGSPENSKCDEMAAQAAKEAS